MPKKQTAFKGLSETLRREDFEALRMARELREILTHLSFEGKLSLGKNLNRARGVLRFFKQRLNRHLDEEEKVVFPFLKTHIPKLEPLIAILHSEHEDFRKNLGRFQFWLRELVKEKNGFDRRRAIEKLKETGIYLVYLLEGHAQEESEVLYKVADRQLRQSEKRKLLKKMNRRNGASH